MWNMNLYCQWYVIIMMWWWWWWLWWWWNTYIMTIMITMTVVTMMLVTMIATRFTLAWHGPTAQPHHLPVPKFIDLRRSHVGHDLALCKPFEYNNGEWPNSHDQLWLLKPLNHVKPPFAIVDIVNGGWLKWLTSCIIANSRPAVDPPLIEKLISFVPSAHLT